MPLAPVDNSGTHLYYDDTGAPLECAEYRTLVLIHGAIFNGADALPATFKPLCTYNAQHGVRLVSVNMRDYHGSTPYADCVLEALRNGDKERQHSVIRAHGLEIAAFLVWFIRKENTPPMSDDRHAGGLALLGWSWGNAMTMAFLAQASELPANDRELLTTHFRSLIILDSARHGLGVPPPIFEGLDSPGRDSDLLPDNAERWLTWTVKYRHSRPVLDAIPSVTLDDLRAGVARSPVEDPSPDSVEARKRMLHSLEEIMDPSVMDRAQLLLQDIDPKIFAENVRAGLMDASTWPHLRVYLVWCDASVPETVFSSWYLLSQIESGWPSTARGVTNVRFQGANHFPHWFYPECTMNLIAKLA